MRFRRHIFIALASAAAVACGGDTDPQQADTAAETAAVNQTGEAPGQQQAATGQGDDPASIARARELAMAQGSEQDRMRERQQARSEMGDLRLVVDQSDRELRIFRGDELVETHDVAVGTEKNPTPIGDFSFNRVDLNPRWVPPDSDWAEDREPKEPGAPDNPMGRARLVYKMPYTIHGTDNLDSLGKAVSHGSIRLANENVIPLAEMLLKAGNSWEGQRWFEQMAQNRDEEFQIPLEENVPLKIQE